MSDSAKMTQTEFLPIFRRVCDSYGLSAEARACAWESCIGGAVDSSYLLQLPARIYVALDRTRGPYLPSS